MGRDGPRNQIVGARVEHLGDDRAVSAPRGDDDHNEGIVAQPALAHRLHQLADLVLSARHLDQQQVGRAQPQTLSKDIERGRQIDAAEAKRVQRGAGRNAIWPNRIVDQCCGHLVKAVHLHGNSPTPAIIGSMGRFKPR